MYIIILLLLITRRASCANTHELVEEVQSHFDIYNQPNALTFAKQIGVGLGYKDDDVFGKLPDSGTEAVMNHNRNLFETDIIVSPEFVGLGTKEAGSGQRISQVVKQWPDGVIPYRFDGSITSSGRNAILKSLDEIARQTCLTFPAANPITHTNYIEFFDGIGCYSAVGMLGGKQGISLPEKCQTHGLISHQIFHTAGLLHEHSRADRDKFLAVDLVHARKDKKEDAKAYNAAKVQPSSVPFDPSSVMHFGPSDLSIDPDLRVFTSKEPRKQNNLGQRNGPSFFDYKNINVLYKCEPKRCRNIQCQNDGTPFKDCDRCQCPLAFEGDTCDSPAKSIHAKSTASCRASIEPQKNWNDLVMNRIGPCIFILEAPENRQIEIFVKEFRLESSVNCLEPCKDYMEIQFGPKFQESGSRYCCSKNYRAGPFSSESNTIAITAFGNIDPLTPTLDFVISYRLVPVEWSPAPTPPAVTVKVTPRPTRYPPDPAPTRRRKGGSTTTLSPREQRRRTLTTEAYIPLTPPDRRFVEVKQPARPKGVKDSDEDKDKDVKVPDDGCVWTKYVRLTECTRDCKKCEAKRVEERRCECGCRKGKDKGCNCKGSAKRSKKCPMKPKQPCKVDNNNNRRCCAGYDYQGGSDSCKKIPQG